MGRAEVDSGALHVASAALELTRFDVRFSAERRSAYYFWKSIIPMALVVFMSWAVFWIHPRHIPPRLGLAATSMLTLIALMLAFGTMLPPIAYLTRLDKFVIGATVIVFAALAEAVTTAALADSGREGLAERINRAARSLFPAVFALTALLTLPKW